MPSSIRLFLIFFKIGLFTLGGGYAMLPLIERELVDKRAYFSRREFLDIVAVAQTAPGILAVNMAIFTGYKLGKLRGALCATLGAVLPSFSIILAVALSFRSYQTNPWVVRIFKAVRPAVVALIAAPVFRLAAAAKINRKTGWIVGLVAGGVWLGKISPVYVIIAAGLGGWIYQLLRKRT